MNNLLLKVLSDPVIIKSFSQWDWNLFVSQAYQNKLLGRCYVLLEQHGLLKTIPIEILWHFESAFQVSLALRVDVKLEMLHIKQALKMAGIVPIYLKGAAYDLAEDDSAAGRVYSDIDIYVPKDKLAAAEQLLRWNGWVQGEISANDEAYYRNWMHEIPPLTHSSRGAILDVHHNLLPPIARIKIDPLKLSEGIHANSEYLASADRILHSILHLFMETEFEKCLRDLSDIDLLIKQHSKNGPNFWSNLSQRADYLGLGRLFFYALRYSNRLLNTPVPNSVLLEVQRKHAPNVALLKGMDWMFINVFSRSHSTKKGIGNTFAHWLIFIRGHWLKMPVHILVYHTLKKAWKGLLEIVFNKNTKESTNP